MLRRVRGWEDSCIHRSDLTVYLLISSAEPQLPLRTRCLQGIKIGRGEEHMQYPLPEFGDLLLANISIVTSPVLKTISYYILMLARQGRAAKYVHHQALKLSINRSRVRSSPFVPRLISLSFVSPPCLSWLSCVRTRSQQLSDPLTRTSLQTCEVLSPRLRGSGFELVCMYL
jgi:hypothetical protein